MKPRILFAALALLLPSCALYDTAAGVVGLPKSSRASAASAPSQTNIYDLDIHHSTLEHFERMEAMRARRAAR